MACHKLNHFNSRLFTLDFLEIVVGYWKLRSFQETQANLNGLLEKPDITSIAELLKRSLMSQVADYSKDLAPCWKTLFQWGPPIFPKSPGINFLYDRGRELSIYWPGRHNLGPGRHFQQNYQPGRPTGCIWPRMFKIEGITIFIFSLCIGLVIQLNDQALGVLKHH